MTINAIIECDLDGGTWQEKVFLTFSFTSGSDTIRGKNITQKIQIG